MKSLDISQQEPVMTFLAGFLAASLVFMLWRLIPLFAKNRSEWNLDFMWLARALDHRWALPISLGFCAFVMGANFLVAIVPPWSHSAGETGDIFGLSTAIFTALSVLLFAATLLAQTRQLRQQAEAMDAQSEAAVRPVLFVHAAQPVVAARFEATINSWRFHTKSRVDVHVRNFGHGVATHIRLAIATMDMRQMSQFTLASREESEVDIHESVPGLQWVFAGPFAAIGPNAPEAPHDKWSVLFPPPPSRAVDSLGLPHYLVMMATCFDQNGRAWRFWQADRVELDPDIAERLRRGAQTPSPREVDFSFHRMHDSSGVILYPERGVRVPVRSGPIK